MKTAIALLLAACFVAPYLGAPETHPATPRSAPESPSTVQGRSGAPHLVPGSFVRASWHVFEVGSSAPYPAVRRVPVSGAPLANAFERGSGHSLGNRSNHSLAVRRISGTATWYCSATSACTKGYRPSDMVAAIDSDLGFHKGQRVRVTYFGRSVVVKIVDVCLCIGDRLIDLTSGAFRRLAPLDLGVIPVMLELAGPAARAVPTAPATDR